MVRHAGDPLEKEPRPGEVIEKAGAEHHVEPAEGSKRVRLQVRDDDLYVRQAEDALHEARALRVVLAPLDGHHTLDTRAPGQLEAVTALERPQLEDRAGVRERLRKQGKPRVAPVVEVAAVLLIADAVPREPWTTPSELLLEKLE